MTLHYLGPAGSFTHTAALTYKEPKELIPLASIEEVLSAVKKNKTSFGIVPVENSVEGVVLRTLDLILKKNLKVIAEINLRIRQHILSREQSLDAISLVYSHPHAFAQSRGYLAKYLPNADFKEMPSTSAAALQACEEPRSAAIGSEQAAKLCNLNVLARDIHNGSTNITRFWIVGTRASEKSNANARSLVPLTKTSCYISVKDKIGALKNLLDAFYQNRVSLTFIQSRPIPNKLWRYGFFIDLLADGYDPLVKKMFRLLAQKHPMVRILGSYPQYGSFNRKAVFGYNLGRIGAIFSVNQKHRIIRQIIADSLLSLECSTKGELKKILAVRCSIMPSLALYKHKHGQSVPDQKRERELLHKFKKYDNLYNLYIKIFNGSKDIQNETIREIKKGNIKERDIHKLSLKDLRYYIDYLDALVHTNLKIPYAHCKQPHPTTQFRRRQTYSSQRMRRAARRANVLCKLQSPSTSQRKIKARNPISQE